ncbi:hydantoinase B/oxoprolinase family protein [Sneathiella marina]|uniref:Hydantoinase B/oxoprolinase family protein n=1 Tax=Sneathiella marina TaxID=2950108 RepID=A0ABY4W4W7_9PROT|nr:hydantoinase B/oxoprolinase family protein [Sneathiella marina]USG59681.1 hydantoinase B/oxoprolinase family protein [Sneathiella marina]
MWQIWIDRGGTFTDIVGKRPDGRLVSHKLLSENPERYKDAAVQGIKDLLAQESDLFDPSTQIENIKMGTTVATNALLERKGDRTLYVTSQGFGDALRIGYQSRPRIFDLDIKLPELLYEQVIEAEERIDAHGTILVSLNKKTLKAKMISAYEQGIRSIAIAFMHGYKYTEHEVQAAEIAEQIGFTQISTSHAVSPLIKLIARGDTTMVDAYLSPILRRYVNQVKDELGMSEASENNPRLMFMQSNGGLTDASLFQGKDAILSGPAGGVVGMTRTAAMSNLTKLIGFDMGGTSTDVTHYEGNYERSFETEVAGVRMRAPMMHIHTVAAGGGSILQFDGSRYRVGPESAGANPGPACYRRGGRLAVTDCNVMLGKIQPEYFPKVFGPDADESLDSQAVRNRFIEMADQIAGSTNSPAPSPEEVAEGFLKIAVENMANAVKQISVQRGYDITEYTLNCFGGAGGQHACLVADALDMKSVFIHPFAGVLSAYGMGLADVRAMREAQLDLPFNADLQNQLIAVSAPLTKDAQAEVLAQGIPKENLSYIQQVHLRYEGTDTSILIDLGSVESMKEAFEAAHHKRFGFIAENRGLVAEALSVEVIGVTETEIDPLSDLPQSSGEATALDDVDMYVNGDWQKVSLYDREAIRPGETVTGPAIITESTGTIVVEEGWRATLNTRLHLIVSRYKDKAQLKAIGTDADPVMLEVFNNLFMSIAEQMGATLSNTAYSVNIKERLDFSCAIFDQAGNLVANAPHVPVHLGSMGESIKTVITENTGQMKPGNVYALNAPYNGGTHLPDVTVITPVFDQQGEKILFYVGSRGHHADIGGRTPGSAPPDSQVIEEEGVLIDNFLLVEEGRFRETETRALLASGKYPCRNPDHNIADLTAQIAANETGVQEVRKMIRQFGFAVVEAYMRHVQDNAEESVRRVLDVLKDGSFLYPLDNGTQIKVDISVNRANRDATIDFTGTSDQIAGNYNAPIAICKAAVLYVFRTLVGDDIPLNEGCMKPLKIIVPERSMINPQYPAAVIAGNTEVSQAITDALYGALGILASSQGTMNNFVYGNDIHQNYETICGGTGAGSDHNGADAVHSHMTNTRMTDPEVLEQRFPVRIEEFSIRQNSGGNGAFKGGNGAIRKMKFLEPMTVTILSSHRDTDPYGMAGGNAGQRGINYAILNNGKVVSLSGNSESNLSAGDMIVIETPGGGGFGRVTEK